MDTSIGKKVRTARESKHLTRDQLAAKLELSAGYLGHIERDAPVHISDRIVHAIKKVLGISIKPVAIQKHNKKSKSWYKNYTDRAAEA